MFLFSQVSVLTIKFCVKKQENILRRHVTIQHFLKRTRIVTFSDLRLKANSYPLPLAGEGRERVLNGISEGYSF